MAEALPLPSVTIRRVHRNGIEIEHRLFSEISKTWAGCPLRSFDLILGSIRETKTSTGLTIQAHLITQTYPIGVMRL
jgi:DDE family transposase